MAMYNCPLAWGSRPTARDDYPLASDNGLESFARSQALAWERGLGSWSFRGRGSQARAWEPAVHRFELLLVDALRLSTLRLLLPGEAHRRYWILSMRFVQGTHRTLRGLSLLI